MIALDSIMEIPQSCPNFDSILSLMRDLEIEVVNDLGLRDLPRRYRRLFDHMEWELESAREVNADLRELAHNKCCEVDDLDGQLGRTQTSLEIANEELTDFYKMLKEV